MTSLFLITTFVICQISVLELPVLIIFIFLNTILSRTKENIFGPKTNGSFAFLIK